MQSETAIQTRQTAGRFAHRHEPRGGLYPLQQGILDGAEKQCEFALTIAPPRRSRRLVITLQRYAHPPHSRYPVNEYPHAEKLTPEQQRYRRSRHQGVDRI